MLGPRSLVSASIDLGLSVRDPRSKVEGPGMAFVDRDPSARNHSSSVKDPTTAFVDRDLCVGDLSSNPMLRFVDLDLGAGASSAGTVALGSVWAPRPRHRHWSSGLNLDGLGACTEVLDTSAGVMSPASTNSGLGAGDLVPNVGDSKTSVRVFVPKFNSDPSADT